MKRFDIYSEPREFYKKMLEDINSAKSSIYIETYIYDADKIGDRFKKALIKKAKQGVKIMILADAWGSTAKKEYFKELIEAGADVKFFREFRYVIRIFTKNHERNHRKLVLIDDYVSYVGSANITESCLNWRELVLRLEGEISAHFSESFMKSWELSGKISKKQLGNILHKSFEIINDVPNEKRKQTEKKYLRLIAAAKKEILIETPYFIPSRKIRKAFEKAIKKGVKIKIVLPYISDVRIIDVFRNAYLGSLYKKGVNIYYYMPKKLHSKLLLIDDKFFLLGSSNLDYRSFIHQYEINLLGTDKDIISSLKHYFCQTLSRCNTFNYKEWKQRSSFSKTLELIGYAVRKYL